ncbi:helix-turn-helix domain-containing protein [Sediminibacillus dalangtanensis]|uniref:Helix-turn-helix domain-containing protein n=1 Tax=Sediminibacillus dalangtanensis TaxID=2729421 RepID=A0ABX7VTN1_9BACI|nr:winged helix-turn-helix domain-containing protein [Sediminibacillus dalangtanensis]QTN00312.1 helix-turn-helix domain-containing protein [Sediminibacillus dalangtanensis]
MKQSVLILTQLEQLKALSDPLRVKILHLLIENSYSGQQLSQLLDVPRQKIHYHLKDLEKNNLIYLVSESKKRNMTEKLYRAVARSFIPAKDLLPYQTIQGESGKIMTLTAIDRTKERALEAPDDAFITDSEDPKEWDKVASQLEVQTTEEKFRHWVTKYQALLEELQEMTDKGENSKWYYVSTFGFQMKAPFFKANEDEEDEHG